MTNLFCKFRFLIPLFVLGLVALVALAVYGLWNAVLTDVVGAKAVTYWQALGILVLARILFGGFPGRRGGPSPWRRRLMMKRWASLTPEQREKMRQEMRQRFGDWPKPPWCDAGHEEEPGPDAPKQA